MKLPTFKGGIHPPDNKLLTADKRIEDYTPAGDLVYPMAQHLGVPCQPSVKRGDRVLAGQKLGDSEAFVSAPILSSVSGTVKEVGLRMTIAGSLDPCVTVENDGLYERVDYLKENDDFKSLDNREILRIIREAGVVGMGGATFPTHVKLAPPPDKTIKWVIVNGAECEPFLNCDNRLMLEDAESVIGGLRVCLHLFPEAEGVVAIEENKPDAIRKMTDALAGHVHEKISVVSHQVKYPQGAEKMLIYSVTGQEIPTGALPADVGCIVVNVRTLYHIWQAVRWGIPLLDRIISVTGDVIREPKNIHTPLGVSVSELIDFCGGFVGEPVKVLSGGPMMGVAMRSIDVPVMKSTSGILALSDNETYFPQELNCIRCSRCIEACPMWLEPTSMDRLVRLRDYESFEAVGGMNCIECGSCAYNCPSRRYLVQSFRDGKSAVNAERRKRSDKK